MKSHTATPPPGSTRLIPALAALLCACGADADGAGWAVAIDTLPSGAVRVVNTPPAGGIEPAWVIEEDLRIGAMEGEGPAVFGQLKGLAATRDGRIIVLDAQASEVRVFGPDGGHQATYGRRGAGPGEFTNPNGIAMGPDGLVRVNDPANARLSYVEPDSGVVASHPLEIGSWGWIWDGVVDSTGATWETHIATQGEEPMRVLRSWTRDGRWRDTISMGTLSPPGAESPGVWRFERGSTLVPFWPGGARAMGPSGAVWSQESHVNRYRLERWTPDASGADTTLIAESRRPPVPVTRAERDSVIDAFREQYGELDWSQIPQHKPVILRLSLDDAGRVWARVSAEPDSLTTYDVFDADGRYAGTAVTALRPYRWLDPVIIGDRFYAVVTDEYEVNYVARGRIVPAREARGDG